MRTLYEITKRGIIPLSENEECENEEIEYFIQNYNKLMECDEFYLDCLSLNAYKKNYQARKSDFINSLQGYSNELEFILAEKSVISQIDKIFDIPFIEFYRNIHLWDLPFLDEKTSEKAKILNYLDDIENRFIQAQGIEQEVTIDHVDDINMESGAARLRVLYLLGFFTDEMLSKSNIVLNKLLRNILNTELNFDSHISAIRRGSTDNRNHPQYAEKLFNAQRDRLKKDGFSVLDKLESHQ
jgi:hypothetical protein